MLVETLRVILKFIIIGSLRLTAVSLFKVSLQQLTLIILVNALDLEIGRLHQIFKNGISGTCVLLILQTQCLLHFKYAHLLTVVLRRSRGIVYSHLASTV